MFVTNASHRWEWDTTMSSNNNNAKRSTCKLFYEVLLLCARRVYREKRTNINTQRVRVMSCAVLCCGATLTQNGIVSLVRSTQHTESCIHLFFFLHFSRFSRRQHQRQHQILTLHSAFFCFLVFFSNFHFQLIFTLHLHIINLWSSIFIRSIRIRLTFPIRFFSLPFLPLFFLFESASLCLSLFLFIVVLAGDSCHIEHAR